MPIRILKQDKKAFLSSNDYIFEKVKEYEAIEPLLKYPKIDGTWEIALLGFNSKIIEEIINKDLPEYLTINAYLDARTLNYILSKYPKYQVENKSKWEAYLEALNEYNITIDRRASSELFKRTKGDIDTIRELLNEIIEFNTDITNITIKHVNSVALKHEVLYPRDVILSAMLKSNDSVPRKGSMLSKYKYGNPYDKLEKLKQSLGQDVAFYALKKYCKNLYLDKLRQLDAKECKEKEVVKIVDVYEILHAYLNFVYGNPKQLNAIFYNIVERRNNDSLFTKEILS